MGLICVHSGSSSEDEDDLGDIRCSHRNVTSFDVMLLVNCRDSFSELLEFNLIP